MLGLTPVDVLQRAEDVWHAQSLPPFVEFTSRVQGQSDPVVVIVRTEDGAIYTQSLPSSPAQGAKAVAGSHLTGPDGSPLGFCFSNAHCSGVLQADPFSTPPPSPTNAKTIATVHAYADAYSVTFGPKKKFKGHKVYDLAMQPRHDPGRYQLREMLVDANDYRVWELTYESVPSRPGLLLRYDFGPVKDTWYLQYICVYLPSRFKGDPGGCTLESTGLWNFSFPKLVPDFYFDSNLFTPTPTPPNY